MGKCYRQYDMESLFDPVGFGKYEYESLYWVIENDIDYLTWMYTLKSVRFSKTLSEFINEVIKRNGIVFKDEYISFLEKEKNLKVEEELPKSKKVISGLDSKLDMLNAITKNAHEQQESEEDRFQKEWLEVVVNYFDIGKMEEDTADGDLVWTIEEKTIDEKEKDIIYRAETQMGVMILWKHTYLQEGSWYVKACFMSENRKYKSQITKNNKGNIKNLFALIKSQLQQRKGIK